MGGMETRQILSVLVRAVLLLIMKQAGSHVSLPDLYSEVDECRKALELPEVFGNLGPCQRNQKG